MRPFTDDYAFGGAFVARLFGLYCPCHLIGQLDAELLTRADVLGSVE